MINSSKNTELLKKSNGLHRGTSFKPTNQQALAAVAQLVGTSSRNPKDEDSIPSQGTCLGCWLSPTQVRRVHVLGEDKTKNNNYNKHLVLMPQDGTKSLLIRHSAASLCLAFHLLKHAKLCSYNIPDAKKQIGQNKNEDTAHMSAKRYGQGSDQCLHTFEKSLGFFSLETK